MLNFVQTAVDVEGVQTQLVVQPFADRTLVLVTQRGRVGNKIQAAVPSTTPFAEEPADPESLPRPPPAIQLTPLLGNAPSEHMQTLHSLYAAQIATLVWVSEDVLVGDDRRNVVVGITLQKSTSNEIDGLDEHERKVFHAIMNTLCRLLNN
ncbi:hypothetical protein F5I97DRAFT_1843773 [Phlebopus sp. FC_14]|nr:hypothetical protein F5I97DRAFT_1843773 [Phlebopus sp. FC_14]